MQQEILTLLEFPQPEVGERHGNWPMVLAEVLLGSVNAVVAQVAASRGLPWVSMRAISGTAAEDLILDYGRLQLYLGDDRPLWLQRTRRWCYLLVNPKAQRRLRRLSRGLALASGQASCLVEAMFRS